MSLQVTGFEMPAGPMCLSGLDNKLRLGLSLRLFPGHIVTPAAEHLGQLALRLTKVHEEIIS